MKDFDSLLNIWNSQKTNPNIDYKEVIESYKKSTVLFKNKIWTELIVMLIAMFGITFFWIKTDFTYFTTHAGISLILCCCMFYIYNQIKSLKSLENDSLFEKPEKHIQFVKKFRKTRYKQNTLNYYIYSAGIGIAMLLYFIEFFSYLDSTLIVIAISFLIIWFLITSFFIRKVYIQKEEKRFKEMLAELERVQQQLSGD
ncbi:hypothetical protein Pedsa_1235 [Pseudopedobacter saltans DSM 12145]|uniref:Uncharacterized protein n=1 Tax=Pseudopedobacter saltans (strain ATCC 51119 / DSM 12145 / JCM 21818 / CCUG 39354 / LMG 10337 / NBRC 100064 / NCIMB 13643) TaxID=762903 RepID=F0SD46_PSESL|nr:hypothetical protein [Pseudopedobacter saltans]ADY51803.1 hypothetical protein Pedsa_1235 [Pseudopedobacter saltans DSM 12145]